MYLQKKEIWKPKFQVIANELMKMNRVNVNSENAKTL